jgi:hypothetical protein
MDFTGQQTLFLDDAIRKVAELVDESVKAGTYAGTHTVIGAFVEVMGELWPDPSCDECGILMEETADWCGECGNCKEHCQGYVDCPRWYRTDPSLTGS